MIDCLIDMIYYPYLYKDMGYLPNLKGHATALQCTILKLGIKCPILYQYTRTHIRTQPHSLNNRSPT